MSLKSSFSVAVSVLAIIVANISPMTLAADNSGEHPYPISTSLPANIQNFLKVETSPDVFSVDYHYGHVDPASNGAYQRNIGTSAANWYIEDQRYGEVDVIGGVLHDDIPLLETGLKMFDFALDREAPNGSFPGSDSHSLFHGTAFFLAAAGPSMIVLQNWDKESSLPDNLPAHITWEIGRLKAAATYLVNAWWSKPGHIDDGGKEERKFEGAVSFQSIGVLANDTWLQEKAQVYAREGMSMTQSNGIWTEHGITSLCCHDSSYQAVGLVYGTRYLSLLPTGTSFYTSVQKTVQLGEQWEFSRTNSSGVVNRSGDDRTGPTCPEKSTTGGCKTIDLQAVTSALMRWSVLANDFSFQRRAYYVWIQDWLAQSKSNKLPAASFTVAPHSTLTETQVDYHYPLFFAGTRFQPVEPVKVWFGTTLAGQTTTDQIGSFGGKSSVGAVKYVPPIGTPAGTYTVKAVGAYGVTRSTSVTILAGPAASMTLKPTSITVQHIGWHYPVYVTVTGFQPNESVTVSFNGTTVGSTTCDQTGAFGGKSGVGPVSFTPPTTFPGTYTVEAKGAKGSDKTAKLTVTGPAASLSVSPASHTVQQIDQYRWPFYVSGIGFHAGSTVTIYWQGDSEVKEGTIQASNVGYFGGSAGGPFKLIPPANTTAGTHTIKAVDAQGTTLTTTVKVTR